MTLQQRLQDDLKTAMRSGDKLRVETIRGARAALQNAQLEASKQQYDAAAREIEAEHADDADARDTALAGLTTQIDGALDDAAQQAVITKEVKRRYDAAEIYHKAGREELASKEEAEMAILETYLPKRLSADEIRPEVAAIISELGLSGPGDMGKLMPTLLQRFQGKAEGRTLSQVARELLAQT